MPKRKAKPPAKLTLIYSWGTFSLFVLVPKRRGEGWLKEPVGHHARREISHAEMELGCDLFGLEGCVHLDTVSPVALDKRKAFEDKAMPVLARVFKCDAWREVGWAEFNVMQKRNVRPDENIPIR